MKKRNVASSPAVTVLTVLLAFAATTTPALAQQRGQYPSGLFVVSSGTVPEPGLTYANIFYATSADRFKGPDGRAIPVAGQFSIFLDANVFVYVPKHKVLGGYFNAQMVLPVASASLAADVFPNSLVGSVTGGGAGLADCFFTPAGLGWHLKRVDVQTGYSFIARTGRFSPGASNNIGSGFWTNAAFGGATVFLTANKALSLNAFNFYEWHRGKEGTNITPGQTESLDYSLLMILPLDKKKSYLLQFGPAGYGQWQTTEDSGRAPALAGLKYRVNGVGFATNVLVPSKVLSLGARYFWEYGAQNSREGQTLMIVGAVSF